MNALPCASEAALRRCLLVRILTAWHSLVLAAIASTGCERVPDELLEQDTVIPQGPLETPPPIYECRPGPSAACSLGTKCAPVRDANGRLIYRCVNDDSAHSPYDACTPNRISAQDGCPSGTTCIAQAPGTDASGRCLPLCRDDWDCEPAFVCVGDVIDEIGVCSQRCDPLGAACEYEFSCVQMRSTFACAFPAGGFSGPEGAGCDPESQRGCEEGLACAHTHNLLACYEFACCTTVCDTRNPDACVLPQECLAIDDSEFDYLGLCLIQG